MRNGAGTAAWCRARLRAAPLNALAFAALVLVTAFTAVAVPRAVAGYENASLRDALRNAPLDGRLVSAESDPVDTLLANGGVGGGSGSRYPDDLVRTQHLDHTARQFRGALRAPLRVDRDREAYGVSLPAPVEVADEGLPRPTPAVNPTAFPLTQQDLRGHARLTAGHWPGRSVGHDDRGYHVEVVLTRRTAQRMTLGVGDVFHLPGTVEDTTAEVVGLIVPRHGGAVYWNAERSLRAPTLINKPTPLGEPQYHWEFAAFLHPGAAPVLWHVGGGDEPTGARVFWHEPLALDTMRTADVPALRGRLASLASGPTAVRLTTRLGLGGLTVDETLDQTLAAYRSDQSAVDPLILVAELGLGTAAVTVLLLWSVLSGERRRDELALMRARGGSRTGLAGRLLAESTLVALPAALCGGALALRLTPDDALPAAVRAWAAVTALAAAGLPVHAAVVHRDRPGAARARRGRRLNSRLRRTLVEGTLLALVVGAVVALRRRGLAAGEEGADPLLAAVPVLVALGAAVLLLRLYPLPLRLSARPTARRRGPVAFLGLTRAGRAPLAASAGIPMVTALVALTLASFGGTVLDGVDAARDAAATRAVGADARIEAADTLPDDLLEGAEHADGVTDHAPLRTVHNGSVPGVLDPVTVLVVDAPSYARLASRTGLGAFPAEALARPDAHGVVPALVTPSLAAKMGTDARVALPGMLFPAQPAVVRSQTPATREKDFVVVARSAVQALAPDAGATVVPDTLLLTGDHLDTHTLRDLVRHGPDDATMTLRSDELAGYAEEKVRSGAQDLYRTAVLAAGGFAALAVLLSLSQSAPERRAVLNRLGTMGMPRRDRRRLLLVEALPPYLLIAVAGAATGLASVPLFGPGIDLASLAGTPDTAPVHIGVDLPSLVVPAACLALFACGVLLLQARGTAGATTLREEIP